MKDPGVRSLDLKGTHSWDEVMQLVKDKNDAYLEAGQNGLRGMGRSITSHSKSVGPYLRLIPNDFFASIVNGGLKLIFELSFVLHQAWREDANIENRLLPISAQNVRK